ncbi:MAG: hypothetical protein ACXW0R_05560 [Gaiellaceae bacterium]
MVAIDVPRTDARELHALVCQAFDLRETPYDRDACEAIIDWHERRWLRALERKQERDARALRLLRWLPSVATPREHA